MNSVELELEDNSYNDEFVDVDELNDEVNVEVSEEVE